MGRLNAVLISAIAVAVCAVPAAHAGTVDREVKTASGTTKALVHVADDSSLASAREAATAAGAQPIGSFTSIRVVAVRGTAEELTELGRSGLATRIEANERLHYFTNTSHIATRGQEVLNGAVTLPGGGIIDGSGIGVAVVDTGVDGTHPDLASRMASNVKLVPLLGTPVSLPDTDTVSLGGHGTHVAGIVAGTGTTYHGAAPGARLHGVGAGTFISMLDAVAGLQWVLDNRNGFANPIRVVNNSWGDSGGTHNPSAAVSQIVNRLTAAGVTVVFAAGNAGPENGTTSTQCQNPTPGVVCVAAYNDENSGTRTGSLAEFSSRGAPGSPQTYPDISAPGQDIASTCRLTLPICALGEGFIASPPNMYSRLSGTSMAAPHIAGIAAQVLEADPALTPAGVEDVLEDTALKFTAGAAYEPDPANPDDTTSSDKGHGLVDVVAAVQAALAP